MPRRDKRQQIMQAVERLFATRRMHEITTDDIAQTAQVGKGTIYHYFKDKEDLFFQTMLSGFDDLTALLGEKVPENAPFKEQLLVACIQISGFMAARRQIFRMMQAEESHLDNSRGDIRRQWEMQRKKVICALAQIISRGRAEGDIRADIPPEVLANFLLGMLRTRRRHLSDAPEPFQQHELVVELFIRGAANPETSSSPANLPGEGELK